MVLVFKPALNIKKHIDSNGVCYLKSKIINHYQNLSLVEKTSPNQLVIHLATHLLFDFRLAALREPLGCFFLAEQCRLLHMENIQVSYTQNYCAVT